MCCYRITREREKKDKTQSSFTKNTRSEKRYKKTINNTHHVAKLLVSDPVPGLIAAVGLSER
jgi:hypothetical protein